MRRLWPMALILMTGCVRERPEVRKPFGERLVDLIFYNLNGCKTDEEVAAEAARDVEAGFIRDQANAERYGSSY